MKKEEVQTIQPCFVHHLYKCNIIFLSELDLYTILSSSLTNNLYTLCVCLNTLTQFSQHKLQVKRELYHTSNAIFLLTCCIFDGVKGCIISYLKVCVVWAQHRVFVCLQSSFILFFVESFSFSPILVHLCCNVIVLFSLFVP